ncbi:MAG: L,D-transpeptidase family protein [Clostridia bacterium]|nr:L,D-transpeptidase family protein [Clostridia bacterium]
MRRFLCCLLAICLAVPVMGAFAENDLFSGDIPDLAVTEATAEPSAEEMDTTYVEADTASATDYQTLQRGDKDSDGGTAYVVLLQMRLIELGFLSGTADGAYGVDTETAVNQFQKLNGLERTGIADPETQRLIFSDISAITTPAPGQTIAQGSDVMRVQTKLAEWGFLSGPVDGKTGGDTSRAVRKFKSYVMDNNLITPTPTPAPTPTPSPTPTPDPYAMPVIIDVPLATPTPEPTPEPNPDELISDVIDEMVLSFVDGESVFPVYRTTVRNGDRGDDVARVQTRLHQLNYLYYETKADGAFGGNTERAVVAFQHKMGLPETGVADEATQRALFSATAIPTAEYVFPYKIGVDTGAQRVYVARWDGNSYSEIVKTMKCSTGKNDTPTPKGTYQAYGPVDGQWHYFKDFNCYAQWAYGIVGGILFHSVIYNSSKQLVSSSVSNLGRKASHGCVRLSVEDAKWICDNCPIGTTVVIF